MSLVPLDQPPPKRARKAAISRVAGEGLLYALPANGGRFMTITTQCVLYERINGHWTYWGKPSFRDLGIKKGTEILYMLGKDGVVDRVWIQPAAMPVINPMDF